MPLEDLKHIRPSTDRTERDMRAVKFRVGQIEQSLLHHQQTLNHHSQRFDQLDDRLSMMEKRLGLVDA